MIKILDKNNTVLAYYDNYIDLHIERKLELDEKTLTFKASWAEVKDLISLEGYIETQDDRFVIKEITTASSDGLMTIVCQMDVEDLEGKAFPTFKSTTRTVLVALNLAFSGTGWTVRNSGTSPTKRRTIDMVKCSAWDILKQAIKTYRIEVSISSKEKIVTVYEKRGEEKGVYFSDDLNLKSLSVNSETYDFYTELEAYGKDDLTFKDINGGKNYVTDYSYSTKKKRFIWKDERYTVVEHLLEDAKSKLEEMARPYVSYEADIIDFSKASDGVYTVLDFDLGDTVVISDSFTGTKEKQRIVSITEYPESPDENTVTLANMTLTFTELTQKYDSTADTVDNITSSNGTVSESAIESVDSSKITGLKESVDGFIAENGQIQSLETANLTVSEKLTAVEGDFGSLRANVASFEQLTTDKFTANEARIDDLEVNKLEAGSAEIRTLFSDYANIKTILSGNIGAGDITSIVLNSTNATFDTAFLKSLIASNISVNDLLAGKILTDKFTVGSESGDMILKDSTATWKDDKGNVRVQIGEDASGNFSIIVYDETGKGQLLNSKGITASGIPDGLIKNEKIATDANIAASKLNIQDLFSTMDASGYQLKATTVFLDEQGQSLSVAFSSMSSSVKSATDDATAAKSAANSALETSNRALEVLNGIDTLSALGLSLSNDAHVVHTGVDGSGGDYTDCNSIPTVYLGDTDVSSSTVFTIRTSSGVTGTWNPSTRIYQVTGLSTDDGYVDFEGDYGAGERYLNTKSGVRLTTRSGALLTVLSGGSKITKRFSISKAPDGKVGLSYVIRASNTVMTRWADDNGDVTFTPSYIMFSAYRSMLGALTSIPGFFKIEESNDFVTYVTKYTTSYAESEKAYYPSNNSELRSIRATFSDASGAVLDIQSVVVLYDTDGLQDRLVNAEDSIVSMNNHVGQLEVTTNGLKESISDFSNDLYVQYANDLAYNFTWTVDGDYVVLSAHVYQIDPETKRRTDITDKYDDIFFTWTRPPITSEEIDDGWDDQEGIRLGSGKTIRVAAHALGIEGVIDGWFYPYLTAYLTTRSGRPLVTNSGKYLTETIYG